MLAQPRASHGPVGPFGITGSLTHRIGLCPDVRVVMGGPTVHTVIVFSRVLTVDGHMPDLFHQRQGHFPHVQGERRPVIHLQVDVGGVVAAPGGIDAVAPNTLQVGSDATGTGTADQQVTAVLEIEHFQVGIGLSFPVGLQPLVDGKIGDRSLGQGQ
ncbi:MAG: hypothetical protein BWY72_01539 [Bacteroidetes bacterium ADurb.Bin416]|nr:MAG: hypothetical protein BWY72_01539 [Bacteroidetes bacterium ADurb.Bin416]